MALPEVLPFDQWVDSEEAQGLEGLDKIKAYGDHYRSTSFASGTFNQQEAHQVDQELFSLARNSGFVDPDDDEVAYQQYLNTPDKPLTDEDIADVLAHKHSEKSAGAEPLRDYLAMRGVEGASDEILAEREALASPFLTKEDVTEAKRAATLRGDKPIFVAQDEEGNLDISIDPNLEEATLTDERLAQIARDQGINSRFLPALKAHLQTPAGLTTSRAKAIRNSELRNVIASTEDEDLQFYRDSIATFMKDGNMEAVQRFAQNAAHHGGLSKKYSAEDIVNGFVDFAKYASNSDQPQFLSTGEVVMPQHLHTRKEDFDAAVDALDISDERKALTKAGRSAKIEAMVPHFHKVASASGDSKYLEHYEKGKASGQTDAEIIESWFSDDANYNKGRQMSVGVAVGALEGFGGLILYPMALAGDEEALNAVGGFMKDESNRQEYAALFGEELGIGYSIMRTAPSVVADIALAIPTGGIVSGASAGTKWTMKQGAKLALRNAVSQTTKQATNVALKQGTAGSVSKALKLTGTDFAKKLGAFTHQSLAIAPTAFNRSAGATYTSVYSSLESQHPDWSAQQIREAAYGHAVVSGAITVGITSAFNGLALVAPKYFGSGVEEWAKGSGGGLTIRQMKAAYSKIALAPNKIPKEIRNYLNLESFEGFVSSVAKEGMKNSWLRNAAKQSSSEAFEEGLDEFINGWRQSAFLNEDTNILDHLKSAGHAAIIGGVFGAGVAFKEGGIRTGVTDKQTRSVEQTAFGEVANRLESGGDLESATVLRGLIAKSRAQKTQVTKQLDTLGRFARRQELQVAQEVSPYDSLVSVDPTLPSVLQKELTAAEEFIDTYKGKDPASLTAQERVDLAAAKIYRQKITDTHTRAETEATEGVERIAGKEEAASVVEKLSTEIARIESRGDQVSPFQAERLTQLNRQREAIRARYLDPGTQTPEPGTNAALGTVRASYLDPKTPPTATTPAPGDGGPGAPSSKLHTQLAQTEGLLARLRIQEKAKPSLRNNPKHRALKFKLRDSRRRTREAIANEQTKAAAPVKWKRYPLEKIAEAINTDSVAPVFDPVTNETFIPTIDPELAVEAIQNAANEKRKLDARSLAKYEKGTPLTKAEEDSLTTEDPDQTYQDILDRVRDVIEELNVDYVDPAESPNPTATRKVRAVRAAKKAAIRKEADEAVDLIPEDAPGVQEAVAKFATKVAEGGAAPDPRSATYTAEGTDRTFVTTETGVTVLENGEEVASEPATSFEEAEATAVALIEAEGVEPDAVTRVETETDDATEEAAAIARGDAEPFSEVDEEVVSKELEEEMEAAAAEFISAELKSIQTGKPTSEILEEEEDVARREFKVVDDIAPILSTNPGPGWSVVWAGKPVAIKGFDPDKHSIAKKGDNHFTKGEVTVVSAKGNKLKREVLPLFGPDVTLYDENGVPQFLSPEDETLFYDLVERGVSEITDKQFKNGTYEVASLSNYYTAPFLRTLRAEVEKRYEVAALPENAILTTAPPAPEKTERSFTEQYIVLLENGQDARFTRAQLIGRRKELGEALIDPKTGKHKTKKSRDIAALERATEALHALQAEQQEAGEEYASADGDPSTYYDLLQKEAHANARYQFAIDQARVAQQERDERAQTLPYQARERVESGPTVLADGVTPRKKAFRVESQEGAPEVRRGLKASEARLKKANKAANKAYADLQGIKAELAKTTNPATLPDLSDLEKRIDKAQHKLASVKRGIRSGDFSESTLVQRILDIDKALNTLPSDTSRRVQYDKDGNLVDTKGQKVIEIDTRSKPISSGREKRIDAAQRDHRRAVRASLKRGKITRGGETINLQFPVIRETVTEADGTIKTTTRIPYTNTPLLMAEAVNLGYEVKVPKKFRGASPHRNPSIRVSRDGFVAEVFHPEQNRWVRSPGDLLEYKRDAVFTPDSLRDGLRTNYVNALPPVRSKDVPHLGKTPLNLSGDQVSTVRDKDNPLANGADDEYILGALDYFDGVSGVNLRRATDTPAAKAAREINRKFHNRVGPHATKMYALEALQQEVVSLDTVTIPPELLATNLETGEKPTEGKIISSDRLDTIIEEAEARLAEPDHAENLPTILEELKILRLELNNKRKAFEEGRAKGEPAPEEIESLVGGLATGEGEVYESSRSRLLNEVEASTIKGLISGHKAEIDKARVDSQKKLAEAHEKLGPPPKDSARQYLRQGGEISDLLGVVEKVGGDPADAKAAAILTYTQNIREFGLALRLLEAYEKGEPPLTWFKKYLKSLDPETRKSTLDYIRARHKSKVFRRMTADEAVAFLEEAGGVTKKDGIAKDLRAWDAGKKKQDNITIKQLRGFLKNKVRQPDLVSKLERHLDAEAKTGVTDDYYLNNYVTRLLQDIAPERGGTRWVTEPGAVARPVSFVRVLKSIKGNYLDSMSGGTGVEVTSIDAAEEVDGGEVNVNSALAAELSEAWGIKPPDVEVEEAENPDVSTGDAELKATEFYLNLSRQIKKSPAAQVALRDLAAELGSIEDPNEQSVDAVLMATHETIFNNPETLELLSPDLRRVVKTIYQSGLQSHIDFGVAEDIQSTIDENAIRYSNRLRNIGVEVKNPLFPPSLSHGDVKALAEWYVTQRGALLPKHAHVLKEITDSLNRVNNWPTVSFLTNANSAYARYTGAYSPQSGSVFINLSKPDPEHAETFLRGLIQHTVSLVKPGSDAHTALNALSADIMESFPDLKHIVTKDLTPDAPSNPDVLRFAMNDPLIFNTLNRKKTSFFRRVVDTVAKAIGITSDVGRKRLSSLVAPKPGQVWGGEFKQTRSPKPAPSVAESAIDILNRLAPSGVRIQESSDHIQPAWVTTTAPDSVFVNIESIERTTQFLSPEAKEQVLRALLNHELAHVASLQTLTDADRAGIFSEMTSKDISEVLSRIPEGTRHLELAEEFLRMKVEQATSGIDSDRLVQSVLNHGTGLRAKLTQYLQIFLNKLRIRFGKSPAIRTAVHMNRVQDALAGIQRGGLPLRPVPATDILGHRQALAELEEGTERTFFSVPIHSTDPAHDAWWERHKRKSRMVHEIKEIDNQVKFKKSAYEAMIKDLHRKIRYAAKKRGTVIHTKEINAALGSTDAYLTETQDSLLAAARAADVAAGLDEKMISDNHLARVRNEQRAHIKRKVAEQKAALDSIRQVDPDLANDLEAFRSELTAASRDVGAIHDGGSLKAIFDDRSEIHLIRSYEFFQSKAFRDAAKVARDDKGIPGYEDVQFNTNRTWAIRDIQDAHFRRYGKNIDGKRAYQILMGLLNEWSVLPPDQIKLNTLTKSSTLFESKEALPEGIRALLGQHSEVDAAANTALKLGMYLGKHEAAESTRKLLLGQGWAYDNPNAVPGVALEPLWNTLQGDGDYETLQGLYARPDERALIEETLSTILPTKGPESEALTRAASNGMRRIFGTSLTLKTLFSVGFFTRNEGAMSFVMLPMQGQWGAALGFGGASKKSREAAGLAWGGLGMRRFAEGKEEYTLELIRYGIIHDDVTAGLLKDIHGSKLNLGTDIQKDLDEFAGGGKPKGWLAKALTRAGNAQGIKGTAMEAILSGKGGYDNVVSALSKVNEAIDAKGKIQLYELELETLKKFREETGGTQSDEDLKKMAASKVHKTLPGHSQVYAPVRQLTRSNMGLLIAPFARFKGETVRIAKNTLPLAWDEWKMGREHNSPALKRRAINRAVSFIGVNAFFGTVFTYLASHLFDGLDDEDQEGSGFVELRGEVGKAIRSALPKWAQSHSIMARRNEDGTVTTYDLTYYNPLSLIQDPLKVLWDRSNTDGLDAGVKGFTDAIFTDFIGEGIGPGALRQVLSNSDDYGSEIYLPTDDIATVTEKSLAHYFHNALKPGIVSKSQQVYKSLTLGDEAVDGDRYYDALPIIVGEFTGIRPFEYKESELMKRSARNTKLKLDQIQRLLSPLNSPAFKTEDEIKDAVRDYNEAYVDLWKQHRRSAAAWAEFTGDDKSRVEYAKRMVDAGHSKDRTRKAIFGGVVDRFIRSRDGLENIYRAAETAGAEHGEKRVKAAVDAMLEEPRLIPLTD